MQAKPSHAAIAALLAATLLAACGGSASSPSAQLAMSTASASASVEPSGAASGAEPSQGAVAELEALIPAEIGGITLQKYSMRGDEFVSSGTASQEAQEFLEGLGVSTDDVAVAVGFGASAESGDLVAVFVFQARGAGSDRLVSVFKEGTDKNREAPLVWEPVTVGGKQVERTTEPEQGQVIYLYAMGDRLFYLAATQEEHAEEALAALP